MQARYAKPRPEPATVKAVPKPATGARGRKAAPKPIRARGRKTRRGTVRELHKACSAAPVVYLALLDLAGRSTVCTPTRETLSAATGIPRLKTISAALTALEKASWIRRAHVPVLVGSKRTATLLRIQILGKGRYAPSTGRFT
ncbi:MAG: hypothetical protein IPM18_14065 [Phycisphaerales bacterium]|nr:hypothetical protein [Phycisphaerales bacterium]